jgi:NhaP-type Na+/H+ or K+/H+ antiporter
VPPLLFNLVFGESMLNDGVGKISLRDRALLMWGF